MTPVIPREICRHGIATLDCQICFPPRDRERLQDELIARWLQRRVARLPVRDRPPWARPT